MYTPPPTARNDGHRRPQDAGQEVGRLERGESRRTGRAIRKHDLRAAWLEDNRAPAPRPEAALLPSHLYKCEGSNDHVSRVTTAMAYHHR